MNYDELAAALEEMREAFRAMVAGLVADGFTDEQARQLIVAIYMNTSKPSDDD